MFNGCSSLKELDLSSFDTSKVMNMSNMFNNSNNLKTIYVSNLWNTDKVTSSSQMFYSCKSIVGGENNSVTYNGSKIDKTMANYTTGYLTYKG